MKQRPLRFAPCSFVSSTRRSSLLSPIVHYNTSTTIRTVPFSVPSRDYASAKRITTGSNEQGGRRRRRSRGTVNSKGDLWAFLKEHPKRKKARRLPSPLCFNRYNFSSQDREASLHATYRGFALRIAMREGNRAPNDKAANPIVALQSAPGGGKSFFLDLVAAREKENLQAYCCYFEGADSSYEGLASKHFKTVLKVLSNAVSVCVTYNMSTGYDDNVDSPSKPIEHGLAVRMLYSYFIDPNQYTWSDFCSALSTCPNLSIVDAVRIIQQEVGQNTCILLCVDELVKAASDITRVTSLVTQIGQALSSLGSDEFLVVVSTLDSTPVREAATGSGRRIEWVPCFGLSDNGAQNLFLPIFELINTSPRIEPHSRQKQINVVKCCITYCAGHPRSLELLFKVLQKHFESTVEEILILTRNELLETAEINALSPVLVIAALRGKEIDLKMKLDNFTFAFWIQKGAYINCLSATESKESSAIPKISPMILYGFIKKLDESNPDHSLLRRCLNKILQTDLHFSGLAYEEFHSWWEVLYRLIHPEHQVGTLASFYAVPSPDKEEDKPLSRIFSRELNFRPKKGVLLLDTQFPPPDGSPVFSGGIEVHDLEDFVLLPAANNPGFDCVIVERDTAGRLVVINIENRFSAPGSTTTMSCPQIMKKYDDMVKQYRPYLQGEGGGPIGKMGLTESDLILVACCWRMVTCETYPDPEKKKKHPRPAPGAP